MSCAGHIALKIPDITAFYDKTYPPEGFCDELSALYDDYFPRALNGETCSFECPIPDTMGHKEWYITYLIPMYKEDSNELEFILASSANITERKESEFKAEQLHNELLELSKERAESASNVLHDVGNVLNTIYMSLDIIQEEREDAEIDRLKAVLSALNTNIASITNAFDANSTAATMVRDLPMLSEKFEDQLHRESKVFLNDI
jgi:hypothetical protein